MLPVEAEPMPEAPSPAARADEKPRLVREMFASIAARYDLLNDVLSFRRHHAWRRTAARLTGLQPGDVALDVCSGTGDLAIALAREVGPHGRVVGSDFCLPMLALGVPKLRRVRARVHLLAGDALRLPFRSGAFDAVAVGFGIRNVADTTLAMQEMARVTRAGGRVVCLEFTQPERGLIGAIVRAYQNRLLPAIGAVLSRAEAYRYLPQSIQAFHTAYELAGIMESVGLTEIRIHTLNFGSVCIHVGTKR